MTRIGRKALSKWARPHSERSFDTQALSCRWMNPGQRTLRPAIPGFALMGKGTPGLQGMLGLAFCPWGSAMTSDRYRASE